MNTRGAVMNSKILYISIRMKYTKIICKQCACCYMNILSYVTVVQILTQCDIVLRYYYNKQNENSALYKRESIDLEFELWSNHNLSVSRHSDWDWTICCICIPNTWERRTVKTQQLLHVFMASLAKSGGAKFGNRWYRPMVKRKKSV